MIPQDCQNSTTTTMMSTTTTKNASNILLEDSGGSNNGGGVIVSNKSPGGGYHDNNSNSKDPPPIKTLSTTNHNQQQQQHQRDEESPKQQLVSMATPPSVSPSTPVAADGGLLLDFSNNIANQTPSQQLNLQKLQVPSNQPTNTTTNNTNTNTNTNLGVIKTNLNSSSSSSSPSPSQQQLTRRNSNNSSSPDVSPFPGSIVYNPDGSAYIIEDSNMKHELGSSELKDFPRLASAHYLRADNPEMHSYRVYNARGDSNQITMTTSLNQATKPILMCFICKLSFGYGKSFLQHGVQEHKLEVNEVEVGLIGRNSSAILQVVGRGKEVLLSFLEPILKMPQQNPPLIDLKPLLISPSGGGQQRSGAAAEVGPRSEAGIDLRKSPTSDSSDSPPPTTSAIYQSQSPQQQQQSSQNYITGTTIGVCPEHTSGRPSGLDCSKCELILNSSRLGLNNLHTRNSCKTLKCPKCNWHYKYQETLEIHMKEKHPESEQSCVYCIAGQPHPRLARGETYTCGYKPYRCEVCNYSTTTKGNLSIHMQSDKHLNNMQELQSGVVTMQSGQELLVSPGAPGPGIGRDPPPKLTPRAESRSELPPPSRTPTPSPSQQMQGNHSNSSKPKPSFRCDVCNYETNVARNLRIHMTSEKHTHNMCVLQQNVKHMQHLQALQLLSQQTSNNSQLSQQQQQVAAMETAAFLQQLQQHAIQMQQSGSGGVLHSPGGGAPSPGSQQPTESELADIAYNQALLIQMLTGQQPNNQQNQQLQEDGLNPSQMDPPPDPPNPNPNHIYQCTICNYSTDNLELLNNHLNQDRTKSGENEVLNYLQGNYNCKLCSYKTNLKANFQLHCKTDKHLQKLQFLNHLREGGRDLRGVINLITSQNTMQIQLHCNCCDFYTNSMHKLQVHSSSRGHEILSSLFGVLREKEIEFGGSLFYCGLCGFNCRGKGGMLQHGRSPKHLQLEQLSGKEPSLIYRVLPADGDRPPSCSSTSSNFSGGGGVSPGVNPGGLMRILGGGGEKHTSVLKSALTAITCPYCDYATDQELKLHQHLLTNHSGSSSASSSDFHASKLLSSTPWKQQQIEDSEEEGSSEVCPLCQQPFPSKSSLESHVVSVHQVSREGLSRLLTLVSSTNLPQQVESCNRRKRSKSKPTRIIQQVEESETESESEQTAKKSYHDNSISLDPRCSVCNTLFHSYELLFRHQSQFNHFQIKSVDGATQYSCWCCTGSYGSGVALQQHYIQEHLQQQQQKVAGLQLEKQPPDGSNILISEKHVYKYRCGQCSLAFKTIDKLQLHSQYHTIRDSTKCNNCCKSFRSAGGLERHLQAGECKQNADVQKQEESSDSSDSTASGGNYEDCLNTVTLAEDNYSDPGRKYKCHRCKLAFTRQSYLTSHNKTLLHRKGEKLNYPLEKYLDPNRPYKCEVCKESFTQKNILLVHFNSVSHLHKLKNNSSSSSGMGSSGSNSLVSMGNLSAASPQQQQQQQSLITSPQQQQIIGLSTSPQQQQQQQQQQQIVGSITMATSNQSPPPAVNMSSSSVAMATSNSTSSQDDSVDNSTNRKPYKCNICRVAYTQGSTLDIHMRSVLHQTRASKLQELVQMGQVDVSRPLIEQPNNSQLAALPQQPQLQAIHQMPLQSSDPCSMEVQLDKSGEKSTVAMEPNSSSVTMEITAEEQQPRRPTTTTTTPTTTTSLYKHILQSYGFELAMHHNEYNTNTRLLISGEENQEFKSNYPELVKSECSYCGHVFSSVWILKEHLEQVHCDLIDFGLVEEYATEFRRLYEEKKNVVESVAMEIDEQAPPPPPSHGNKSSEQLQQQRIESNQQQNELEQMNESLLQQLNIGLLNPAVFLAAVAAQVQQQQLNAGQQLAHPSSLMMMPPIYGNSDLASVVAAAAAASAGNFNFPGMQQMQSPFTNFGNYGNGDKLQELIIKQEQMQQQREQREQQHIHSSSGPTQSNIPSAAAPQQQQQLQNSQPTKRARTRITDDQLKVLRAHFDINNSPSEEQIQTMALQSGLPPKVIKHWFRNTLFKERQRNKDSPYNFSNPPSTTLNLEEYEKTGEAKVGLLSEGERAEYSKQDDINLKSKLKKELLEVDVGDRQQQQQNNPSKSMEMTENGRPTPAQAPHLQQFQDLPTNLSLTLQNLQQFNSNNLLAYYQQVQNTNLGQLPHRYESPDSDSGSEKPVQKKSKKSKKKSEVLPEMLPPPASITPLPLNMSPSPSPSSSGLTTPPLGQGSSANSISGLSSGKRANRTRFTDYQIKVLQEFFENNAYPKDDDLEYLSKLLGLSPRVIVVWFQNARQKARKVYENQPPAAIEVPPHNPSTTPPATNANTNAAAAPSEENRFQRTPGLNYQCKKCLLVFQRYYELIRHQKTHCFKEEDAKRSAQAQAAAANVASKLGTNTQQQNIGQGGSLIGMSSNESNSSRDSNGQCSPVNTIAGQLLGLDKEYSCDKCGGGASFSSYEHWREHQVQHLMQYNVGTAPGEISIPSLLLQQQQQSQPFNLTTTTNSGSATSGGSYQHRSAISANVPPPPINLQSPASIISGGGALHYKQSQVYDQNSESSNEASLKRKYSTEDLTEDEYDHSNSQVQRDKRLRTTILPEQLDYLYQKYQIESNPSRKMLEQIAREVGLKKRVVQVWFQNTRARERKGQYRAHSQVINKKCPYCSAIFKVKSALESHLLSKHGEDGLDVDGIEELVGEECGGVQQQGYSVFGGGVLDLSAAGGKRAPQNDQMSDDDDDDDGGNDDEDSL